MGAIQKKGRALGHQKAPARDVAPLIRDCVEEAPCLSCPWPVYYPALAAVVFAAAADSAEPFVAPVVVSAAGFAAAFVVLADVFARAAGAAAVVSGRLAAF